MKATYISPVTKVTFVSPILMITDSTGHNNPGTSLGKETVVVEEEKEKKGIPTKFSNLWGDDED